MVYKFRTFTAQDYIPVFKQFKITLVVRLNKPQYEAKIFEDAGIKLVDLYFVDGSTPSPDILQKFIELVENNRDGTAVHCKAGLGRTGTLIALWAMKHYRFCAADFIGWIRVLRPGSILGPQQQFLLQMQKAMFKENEKSEMFASFPEDYKQFVYHMEKTDQAIEAKMTEEELKIARFGQTHQGTGLVDAKLTYKS